MLSKSIDDGDLPSIVIEHIVSDEMIYREFINLPEVQLKMKLLHQPLLVMASHLDKDNIVKELQIIATDFEEEFEFLPHQVELKN